MSKRRATGQLQPAVTAKRHEGIAGDRARLFTSRLKSLNLQFAEWVKGQASACATQLWLDGVQHYQEFVGDLLSEFADIVGEDAVRHGRDQRDITPTPAPAASPKFGTPLGAATAGAAAGGDRSAAAAPDTAGSTGRKSVTWADGSTTALTPAAAAAGATPNANTANAGHTPAPAGFGRFDAGTPGGSSSDMPTPQFKLPPSSNAGTPAAAGAARDSVTPGSGFGRTNTFGAGFTPAAASRGFDAADKTPGSTAGGFAFGSSGGGGFGTPVTAEPVVAVTVNSSKGKEGSSPALFGGFGTPVSAAGLGQSTTAGTDAAKGGGAAAGTPGLNFNFPTPSGPASSQQKQQQQAEAAAAAPKASGTLFAAWGAGTSSSEKEGKATAGDGDKASAKPAFSFGVTPSSSGAGASSSSTPAPAPAFSFGVQPSSSDKAAAAPLFGATTSSSPAPAAFSFGVTPSSSGAVAATAATAGTGSTPAAAAISFGVASSSGAAAGSSPAPFAFGTPDAAPAAGSSPAPFSFGVSAPAAAGGAFAAAPAPAFGGFGAAFPPPAAAAANGGLFKFPAPSAAGGGGDAGAAADDAEEEEQQEEKTEVQRDSAWQVLFSKAAVLYMNVKKDGGRGWESRGKGQLSLRHMAEGPNSDKVYIAFNSDGAGKQLVMHQLQPTDTWQEAADSPARLFMVLNNQFQTIKKVEGEPLPEPVTEFKLQQNLIRFASAEVKGEFLKLLRELQAKAKAAEEQDA